jgi:hypothetical protein
VRVVVVVQRQPELFEIVAALGTPSRFASRLHGGEQKRDQNTDDGNNHQQFHQGKTESLQKLHGTSPENQEQKK